MQTIHHTPVLQSKTSKGLAKFWQGHVATDGTNYFTFTTFWQELAGGGTSKVQESEKTRIEAKNVGRSNETTLEDQAVSEMNSDSKKQRDKGYRAPGEAASVKLLPMLAQDYRKASHRLKFPLVAQPKYDGNRAVTDGKTMWSRKAIDFPSEIVAHIIGGTRNCPPELLKVGKKPASTIHTGVKTKQVMLIDLFADDEKAPETLSEIFAAEARSDAYAYPQTFPQFDTEGYLIDGELIMPPGTLLQHTRSATSKYSAVSQKLLYRVYDIFITDMGYMERYAILQRIVAKANNPNIVLAPIQWVKDAGEMMAVHKTFMAEGWEGTMLRQLGLGYAVDKRDVSLMKLKDFKEEEFTVLDVINAGEAKFEGCGKFVMDVGDGSGKTFECVPEGTLEYKRQLLIDRAQHIGKRWTVRWPDDENGGLSEDGKPKYAVAVAERPTGV